MQLRTITSRENRSLIIARKVRDGKERGLIFIEGRRLVNEAIRSGVEIDQGFIEAGFHAEEILDQLSTMDITVSELAKPLFRSMASTVTSQGVIVLARRPGNSEEIYSFETDSCPVFVFLQEIGNPSNLGAVLRSAEAAGVRGIFISKNSADVYSPKALRASMGSAFRVGIRVEADLEDVVARARSMDIRCVAVDSSAGKSYLDVDWKRPRLLVFGSEGHGLSDSQIDLIGDSISIPMEKEVESLNLAVAAGIVLFEGRRQLMGGN